MTSKTTTQYTCDLCENVAEVDGTILPRKWARVNVEVSLYSGRWASGTICDTCLGINSHSNGFAVRIYKLFCGKKNK